MHSTSQGPCLRIAYIVGAFPNLSETFVVNQIVGMAVRGHEVDVYTTGAGGGGDVPQDIEQLGLLQHTHCLAAGSGMRGILETVRLLIGFGWRARRLLWRLLVLFSRDGLEGGLRLCYACLTLTRLHARHYDVIHAQFGPYGVLAAQLVQLGALDGAIVTSFRGYDLMKHLRVHPDAYRDLFHRGALFLPVSQTLATRLLEVGCSRNKIHVHRSGVSCERLRYRESRPSDGEIRVVTVARLVEKKGLSYAIEAVARVLASGKRVSYTVIGDGPLRTELEALVHQLGIEAHVRLAGAKGHTEVLDAVYAADVLIAPSITARDGDEEGVPNSIKEAMAMGLPVIGTRHGGIPELIEDGVAGFLIPERDVAALAERLTYLIEHPDAWPAMSRAARRRIEAEYDIAHLNDELVELYRQAGAPRTQSELFRVSATAEARAYEWVRRT